MFYRIVLSLLFLLMFQSVNMTAADNLLKNPQFRETHTVKGKLMAQQWKYQSWGEGSSNDVKFAIDTKIFHSTQHAASIKQVAGERYCHFTQKVKLTPLASEQQLNVSAWMLADNAEFGSIVIIADTAKKKAKLWKRVVTFKGSFDWKRFADQITIPVNVNALTISIRLKGTGKLWVDDCEMSLAGQVNNLPLAVNLLKNSALTGKINPDTGLPSGWNPKSERGYENTSDIGVTGTPAILRINWLSGGAKFGVSPMLKSALPPGNYSLRAQAKTSASSKAMLSVGNYQSQSISAKKWSSLAVDFKVEPRMQPELILWNLGAGVTEYKNISLVKIAGTISAGNSFPITALAMPVEINRLLTGREEFNSFADNPVPLAFVFKGKGHENKTNQLIVEIPLELEIIETFNSRPSKYKVEQPIITEITRNGKPYLRYSYTNPAVFSFIKPNYAWERKLVMAIEPVKSGLTGKSFPIYWYITSDKRKGEEHILTMNILPPLADTKLPENFPIICWGIFDSNFSNPTLLNKVAQNFERAGIKYRNRVGVLKYQDEFYRKRGWKFFTALTDYYEKRHYGNKFPGEIRMSVSVTGGSHKDYICPTFFNNNKAFKVVFHKFLDELCLQKGTQDGEIICYDIEPWQPQDWCVCENCRKNFAKQYSLDVIPTVKELRSKYDDQWCDFRSKQTAVTTKIYTEYFRSKFPNCKILDYDYVVEYNKPDYRDYFKKVAKDPLLNEQYFDAHLASYYHILDVKSFDMLKCNMETLKKSYYPIVAIDRVGYLSKNKVLSPVRMRLLLLAAAVNGAEGISIFPGMHIDGLMLKMFNQTLPVIGQLDKFFKKGAAIDTELQAYALPYSSQEIKLDGKINTVNQPNWSKFFRYRAQRHQQEILISLFNYNPRKTLFVQLGIKLESGKYTIIDVTTGLRVTPDSGQSWSSTALAEFTAKVAPESVTFLLIRKYKASDDKLSTITQQTIKQEFIQIKK